MTDVWVLTVTEDGQPPMVEGVFEVIEAAKHHLEGRYPFLEDWAGCPEGCWHSWTGKHSVKIVKATLFSDQNG